MIILPAPAPLVLYPRYFLSVRLFAKARDSAVNDLTPVIEIMNEAGLTAAGYTITVSGGLPVDRRGDVPPAVVAGRLRIGHEMIRNQGGGRLPDAALIYGGGFTGLFGDTTPVLIDYEAGCQLVYAPELTLEARATVGFRPDDDKRIRMRAVRVYDLDSGGDLILRSSAGAVFLAHVEDTGSFGLYIGLD